MHRQYELSVTFSIDFPTFIDFFYFPLLIAFSIRTAFTFNTYIAPWWADAASACADTAPVRDDASACADTAPCSAEYYASPISTNKATTTNNNNKQQPQPQKSVRTCRSNLMLCMHVSSASWLFHRDDHLDYPFFRRRKASHRGSYDILTNILRECRRGGLRG